MQTFVTILLFIGGLIMWIIPTLLYVSSHNRITKIVFFVLACVPFLGFFSSALYWGLTHGDPKKDNKLNRFLFDKIDWEENNYKINHPEKNTL